MMRHSVFLSEITCNPTQISCIKLQSDYPYPYPQPLPKLAQKYCLHFSLYNINIDRLIYTEVAMFASLFFSQSSEFCLLWFSGIACKKKRVRVVRD